MKRFLTIVFVLMFSASAYAGEFGWTLSDSPTNVYSNSGTPVAGLVSIYLWYYCTNNVEGFASAEFDIVGTTVPLSFTPANGFLNAGGATNLLLAVGGCPYGPIMAGNFLVYDALGAGFNLCPAASAANGLNVSVNCVGLLMYWNDYIGYANDGTVPCTNTIDLCYANPIEGTSWGFVKSLYR
jgi:hypothetical protein